MIKFKKIFMALLSATIVLTAFSAVSVFADGDITVTVDGNTLNFDVPPQSINDRTMVPMRKIFEALNATIEWDDATQTVTATKGSTIIKVQIGNKFLIKNDDLIALDVAPVEIDGRTLVPVRAISESLGCDVTWIESTQTVEITSTKINTGSTANQSVMQNTYIGDDYRLSEDNVQNYNGIMLFGTMAMHPEVISSDNAKAYAKTVNALADNLTGVNVYSILIPTSDEFYAPRSYYKDQVDSFKTISNSLNENVIAVNATENLWAHAGEKIYFSTDHHWTQRGSYYAYQAFKSAKGETAPTLDSYQYEVSQGFVGSFAQKMSGTVGEEVLNANPDEVEKFYPASQTEGTIYNDQEMQDVKYSNVPVIKKDYNSYSAFIAGDNPLTVYKSSVGNGKKLVILKESYGNAFSTWNVDDYSEVYIIDIRRFNGNQGNDNKLSLSSLYQQIQFNDLVIITYPPMINTPSMHTLLSNMK